MPNGSGALGVGCPIPVNDARREIVDQDIDAAEPRNGGFHDLGGRLRMADVSIYQREAGGRRKWIGFGNLSRFRNNVVTPL